MTPADAITVAITPALALLPEKMDSIPARAMLLAIGLQESDWRYRRQLGGPARGFYQFERGGGVIGVLTHRSTRSFAHEVTARLNYPPQADVIYDALENNDVLATVFARLLLWTLPEPLPFITEVSDAYAQYIKGWRPGKPHPDRWPACFSAAWRAVT